MSRFNKNSDGIKTENLAGGQAYKQSNELELLSIMMTSFAKDEFYRTASDTFMQVAALVRNCDNLFVAKAAIYARTVLGMRSISHVVAAELSKHISGEKWAKNFFESIVYRPDDMMEILSFQMQNSKKIPNAIKKGFAKAFDKFNAYNLSKYRAEGKNMKLVDVVNLVHPKPCEGNSEALKQLINGNLKSFDTWETDLSNAGQVATNKSEKAILKRDVWRKLILEKKIGYFALLRNLRNILEQAPQVVPEACNMLVNHKLIAKSLVLPFRFSTAYKQILELNSGKLSRRVLESLAVALDISMLNVPEFDGETLVVCDYSGSMGGGLTSPRGKATLFGIALAKKSNSDFMIFGDHSEYINYNPLDATISIINNTNKLNNYYGLSIGNVGHGTNFNSIFETANKKYDRIVIFSDMQGWDGYYTPVKEFYDYKERFNANPKVYSFDLNSYGTMQFPENNVYCLAGFSAKVFDIMKLMENDKNALFNTINKIQL